jgi:hypothetical protein
MNESYCPKCYRPLRSADAACATCAAAPHPASRAVLLIGAAGLPLLVVGVTSLNLRLCLAGGLLSGVAAVVYAVLAFRA